MWPFALWLMTLAILAGAIGVVVSKNRELEGRALRAERRFDLLQQLVPSLTPAVVDSTKATCARILERLDILVPSHTRLCFYIIDGRLVLGARAGNGYADFLREGMPYEGGSIVDLARDRATAFVVGPIAAQIPPDIDVLDAAAQIGGADIGPAAGSRDRVWALATPLTRTRGRGLQPETLGVVYLERSHAQPFSGEELQTALTVSRLAADALERALFADAMRRDAAVDGLTGLMTPTAFRHRLRDEVAGRRDVALFFIDTDRFKLFNDTYGHVAGDGLLRRLAATFEELALRSGGFAGRNGGDEFCIALVDRTKDSAVEMAERVRETVEATGSDEPVPITVSVGVAHFPADVAAGERQPAERLLEIADSLMYEAKRSGRNRVEFLRLRAQPRAVGFPGEGPIPRL